VTGGQHPHRHADPLGPADRGRDVGGIGCTHDHVRIVGDGQVETGDLVVAASVTAGQDGTCDLPGPMPPGWGNR
jgi:hypothetical protein